MRLLAFSLSLVACGAPPVDTEPAAAPIVETPPAVASSKVEVTSAASRSQECQYPGLGRLVIPADKTCYWAMWNYELAVYLLTRYDTSVIPKAEMEALAAKIEIHVDENEHGGVWLTASHQAWTSPDMDGLAHEILHAIEDSRGLLDPADPHKGWDANPLYTWVLDEYGKQHHRL